MTTGVHSAWVALAALLVAAADAMPAAVAVRGPKLPNGKTYCCGEGSGPDCGGPDWTPIKMAFGQTATTVDIALTIDSAASKCTAEQVKVDGTAVSFPNLASKTDCFGVVLRGTGALNSDLEVTYDPNADSITVEVDSEGIMATLPVCK